MARTKSAELLIGPKNETVYEVQENEPEPQTAHDDALEDFLNNSRATGGDSEIIVRRVQDTGNPNSTTSYCGKFPVDKYDYFTLQDVIKNKWGGGDYRLFCMGQKNGKRQILQNQLITIEAEIKAEKSENSEVVSLLREVLNRQTPPAQNTSSMLSQISELATVMKMLQPPERDSMGDFMKSISLMKELGLMGGGMDEEKEINPMWSALAQAMPVLVQSAMQTPPVVHPKYKPNPIKKDSQYKRPTKKPKEKGGDDMIKIYLQHLQEYCSKNMETEFVADQIAEKAPDFDALINIIKADDFIDKNAKGFWEVEKNREWLEDLRQWLLAGAGLESIYADEFEHNENEHDGVIEPIGENDESDEN